MNAATLILPTVDTPHGQHCTCHMCAPESAQKVSKP